MLNIFKLFKGENTSATQPGNVVFHELKGQVLEDEDIMDNIAGIIIQEPGIYNMSPDYRNYDAETTSATDWTEYDDYILTNFK